MLRVLLCTGGIFVAAPHSETANYLHLLMFRFIGVALDLLNLRVRLATSASLVFTALSEFTDFDWLRARVKYFAVRFRLVVLFRIIIFVVGIVHLLR